MKWPYSLLYIAMFKMKNITRSASAINLVTVENIDDFHYKYREFAVGEKKWDTKEDKGKSMMHAFYMLWYAKRHLSG